VRIFHFLATTFKYLARYGEEQKMKKTPNVKGPASTTTARCAAQTRNIKQVCGRSALNAQSARLKARA